ncbi:MAG TPA: YukJ family protein [Alloacidobacterium sp.]|nr:YukJ family protein [Alloacidobacterium sp.]
MPIYKYSVLKGDPQSGGLSPDAHPHYLISVNAAGTTYQIAVNIESTDDSQVLYFINENYTPPDAGLLDGLAVGMTPLTAQRNPAVDYVRSVTNGQPIVMQAQMQLLPLPGQTNSSNLQNAVIQFLNQAIADANGTIYAFGSQYTDGTGIHDIHMNQGNPPGSFEKDNGIWQDGMLVFELPASGTWAAIFIAFQTESWSTDDNGNPV